jgi:membrane-bound lytic murein transglycosylase D
VAAAVVAAVASACAPHGPRVPAPVPAAPAPVPAPAAEHHPAHHLPRLACLAHPAIDAWEARLRGERRLWAATVHGVARGEPHLRAVRRIVDEAGLPRGLALLPVVESGFRPRAVGPRGSRGVWQLQAATARRFGLVVRAGHDERLDPERSTRAAARYLGFLYERYGQWPLALAAYNAGEGRVDRALARRPGGTVWDLVGVGLPITSGRYVSRFLAVVRIVEGADECDESDESDSVGTEGGT